MSYNYEFKFYNPHIMLSPTNVAEVLRGFIAYGVQVIDYELEYRLYRLASNQLFDVAQAIAPDGTCLVGLKLPTTAGEMGLTFQTYPRENKGAQATLSMGEDPFEEAPDIVAPPLLELAKIINLHLPAYFGWGDHELTLQRLEPALRFDRIGTLAWANLFGTELVRRLDQDNLAGLPVYQVQQFKQGTLCLLTSLPGQPLSEQLSQSLRNRWGVTL